MTAQRVVIIGGYGVFGRIIASELARLTDAEIVIAGRNPARGAALARQIGARSVRCDVGCPHELRAALDGACLVIHTAGPFNDTAHPVARTCLEAGAHYLDIADSPAHVMSIAQLDAEARACGLLLCAGASTTPAITAAMVSALCADGLAPTCIAGAISPGNRNPRGTATIRAILRYVGEPVQVAVGGALRERYGWYDGELLRFPRAIGRRRVYTVETADPLLFPARFGAQTVTFKAGLELPALGTALAALAALRHRRLLPNLADQARLLTLLSWAIYPFGSPRGALGVWVEGLCGGQATRRSLALVAPREGPMVAAAPAILLAQRLLASDLPAHGALPCLGLISFDALAAYLAGFGIRAVWGDAAGWCE
jgi:hypothetical protein